MSGQVLSFDAGRKRFASRIAERDAKREAERPLREGRQRDALEASRRRWLADLATWPEPFRRRLAPFLDSMRRPDLVSGPAGRAFDHKPGGWTTPYDLRVARGEARGDGYAGADLFHLVNWLSGDAAWGSAHAREWSKGRVLWRIWLTGPRRIDRRCARTLEHARSRVRSWEDCQEDSIKECEAKAERARRSLERGTIESGPKAGQPYTERTLKRLRTQLADAEERLIENRIELEACREWAHANPLRFALCGPQWRRKLIARMQGRGEA